ncbi:MAG TPA: polysaccharide biosynthesis tyrosine autokinase [Paracoccus solventivorans]|uniref:polysaccharide biosynthesis tyrosine autokinase n=1 Tax=Paracoccus solventivorans TaxID=53463 RepID=UPI002B6D7555|nr:polysaccharide biosynthesis tyrosine autokinase [Paracoccus solventivorans]HMM07897.1 polysaccharide biosynthesis tyrosine autokinase [Paracoccus solventivorans]
MAALTEGAALERDDVDLKTLVAVLWRQKIFIALCAALFLGLGSFQILSTFPVYQADTLIQLEQRNRAPIIFQTPVAFDGGELAATTEIEIISSRMVLGRAVAQNNLDWVVSPKKAPVVGNILTRYDLPIPDWKFLTSYTRKGDALVLTNLQVPPQWVGQPIVVTTNGDGYRINLPNGSVHEAVTGKDLILSDVGFLINVSELPRAVGRQYTVRQISERQAISALHNRLSIVEQGRGSGILELRLTGHNAQEVETTLAAIADAYVRQNIGRSVAEAEGSLDFIKNQLPAAEEKLRTAQLALNRFREEASDRARSQEWLENKADQSFETQALLNQITRVEGDLRRAMREVEQNRSRYEENHPVLRKNISDQGKIEAELSQLLAAVSGLPEVEREIVNLTREVELAQQIYLDLQARYQEIQVLQASTVGSVRIVDQAAASLSPIAPKQSRIIAIWVFLGISMGVFLALAKHWLRRGIRGSLELERSGLPVFATVPSFLQSKDGSKPTILALTRPEDLAVEAVRSLRTSLYFGMIGSSTKAIILTSSAPGAGKTTIAVNLAVVAAQAGQKVVLVDADLRRGRIRKYFDLPRNVPGLSDVLAGRYTLEVAVHQTEVQGLSLVPAGCYPPNPSELLMRKEMEAVIDRLGRDYDLIIIDSPPTLAVTDPVVLARLAGTAILVARHGVTPLGEIEAVKKIFQSSGVSIAGAVLNGFDQRYADPSEAGVAYDYQYSYKKGERD